MSRNMPHTVLVFQKIVMVFGFTSGAASVYLTVLLTLERFYAICILKGTPSLSFTKIGIACCSLLATIDGVLEVSIGEYIQNNHSKWDTPVLKH